MYLHELGDGAGSFTKEEMQAGWVLVFLFAFFFCKFFLREFFFLSAIFTVCKCFLTLCFQETSRI